MTIAEKKEQVIQIEQECFDNTLSEKLQETLEREVQEVVQSTIERALVEEIEEYRDSLPEGEIPRRSGYYPRDLDTEYGRIDDLSVPKLREGNEDRSWNILVRYQRSLGSLFVLTSQMYVLGSVDISI